MRKVYLVWNRAMSECVGFLDEEDAQFASTFNDDEKSCNSRSTLACDFLNLYGDNITPNNPLTMQCIEIE